MDGESPIVEIHGLKKTFALGFFRKKVEAVRDVSLSVKRGEIFGLLGPNGAGKTTTIKAMMGLICATAGRIRILGKPVGTLWAKRKIGYLPEGPYFYDYLSGRELLIFMGQILGLSRHESSRRADGLLERVGLKHAENTALRHYSKGMLQRAGIAQALINDPELVVLDEPFSGLDPLGRKDLRNLVLELGERGKTVIFSSHILSDVELLAQRVAILVRGQSVESGAVHDLLSAQTLGTEILCADPSDELLDALARSDLNAKRIGKTGRIVLRDDQPSDPVIDLLREKNAHIIALHQRKESLEDLVVQRAEQYAPPSAGAPLRSGNAEKGR